jgi:hypothetical protein
VALLTENPPQIHSTKNCPKYGMAESKFVITVAPQNDICPHGKTYPKKAVIIEIRKIITPTIHVLFSINELKYKLRPRCR